ncbi:hypothetical protein H5410_015538 [Solanum commersonii]|uniref:Uncharacterized protein n=1 Tax=Solanum commersonii TaxID=4109 RepID=A0A9J5ZUP7_SOLCO|nr:hypothetical protein H5410_015538 [Solanum commersonii]
MPSPKGKNEVGERKEQSADRRVVLRSRVGLPKVTNLEDAEDQGRKAMKLTKGWIAEPDLLCRMALRIIFLATINTFLNI